ncbi:MAG: glycosyltransferase family 2 protein [Anaerolineae bacterium]
MTCRQGSGIHILVHTDQPTISVTICVYNGVGWVGAAVESILAQSYADFELIIVDDGSTDQTPAVLRGYTDPRTVLLRSEHQGVARARNLALAHARGKYIAVLDADDVAQPERLARQAAFLELHPEVVALGSGYILDDRMRRRVIQVIPPAGDQAIRRALAANNPICHSSVMLRRDAVLQVGMYDESLPYAEDYELWTRLAGTGELANLPDILVTRVYQRQGISSDLSHELQHLYILWRVSNLAITRLGLAWYYRFLPVRSLIISLILDLYRAARYRLLKRGNSLAKDTAE